VYTDKLLNTAGSEKDLHQKEVKLMELQEFYETQLLSHKASYVHRQQYNNYNNKQQD